MLVAREGAAGTGHSDEPLPGIDVEYTFYYMEDTEVSANVMGVLDQLLV